MPGVVPRDAEPAQPKYVRARAPPRRSPTAASPPPRTDTFRPSPSPTDVTREWYEKTCSKFSPHLLNSCFNANSVPPLADVAEAVRIAREALERMGHELGDWMDGVPVYKPPRKRRAKRGA